MAVNIYNQVPFNTYTPRSFQEMLAPVMYAAEEESKLQENYSETGSTVDKAMAYLNPELDKETYAKMQQYKTDIGKAVDDLSTKGFVDSGRKANLYKLKQRYDSDFAGTALQIEQRNAAAMMQAQMAQKDPSYVYKPASNISIDEGVKNPNIWTDIIAKGGISGEDLRQQTALQAKAIKDSIVTIEPKLQGMVAPNGKPILDQYIQKIVKGASPTEIYSAISGIVTDPSKASAITNQLMGIVDNVMTANNVDAVFTPNTQEYGSLRMKAAQGLFEAAGGVDFRNVTDQMSMEQRKEAMDLAAYKQKKQIDFEYATLQEQLKGSGAPQIDGLFQITNPVEVNPKMKENIKKDKVLTNLREALLQEVKSGNASQILETQELLSKERIKKSGSGIGLIGGTQELLSEVGVIGGTTAITKNILKRELNKYGVSTKSKSVAQLLQEVTTLLDNNEKEKSKLLVLGKNYSPRNPDGTASLVNFALNKEGAIREIDGDSMKKNSVLAGSDDAKGLTTGVININFMEDVPITIVKGDDNKIRKYGIDFNKVDSVLGEHVDNISKRFKALYNNLDHPKVNLTAEELLKVTNPNIDWDFNNYPARRQILQDFIQLQSDRDMVLTELQNFGLGESKQTKY